MRNVHIVYFTHNGSEGFEVASSAKVAKELERIYKDLGFSKVYTQTKTLVTMEML